MANGYAQNKDAVSLLSGRLALVAMNSRYTLAAAVAGEESLI
jgi:hypothetical protein